MADPEIADSVSHDWVLPAVQLKVPPPVFEMVNGCEPGFVPPVVAERVSDVPDNVRTGFEGPDPVRFKVTPIVTGDPAAPGAVIVIVSL